MNEATDLPLKREQRRQKMATLAKAFFETFGATIEETEDEDERTLWDVELSSPLTEHFGRETLRLTVESAAAIEDVELLAKGSPVFERMVDLLEKRGELTWLPLKARHAAIEELPEVDRPDHLEGPPQRTVKTACCIELVVKVAYVSEERHEELGLVYLEEGRDPEVVEESVIHELLESGNIDDDPDDPPLDTVIEARLQTALEKARGWARETGKKREQRILEALSLEIQRLTHYFGELIAEHETDDEIRARLAKELDMRVAEEVSKHKLEVQLEPLAAAVIGRPVVLFTYLDDDGDEWVYEYDRVEGEVERRPVRSS